VVDFHIGYVEPHGSGFVVYDADEIYCKWKGRNRIGLCWFTFMSFSSQDSNELPRNVRMNDNHIAVKKEVTRFCGLRR
jgi:hypothetical protein